MTWAVYTRKSSPDERHISLKRQREEGLEEVERRGGTPERTLILVDDAVSGGKPFHARPQGRQLMERLGELEGIVAARLDRLTRHSGHASELYEECRRRGLRLVLCDRGEVEYSADAELMFTVGAALAQHERQRVAERVRGMKSDYAEAGKHMGGVVPFGYARTEDGHLEPHAEEGPVIRSMIERVLSGETPGEVCRWLNAQGVYTSRGNDWTTRTLRRTLTRKRLLNWSVYRGEPVVDEDGVVITRGEPLATPGEVTRLERALAESKGTTGDGRDLPPFLLQGLMRCATCGLSMTRQCPPRRSGGSRGVREYAWCHARAAGGCGQTAPMEALVTRVEDVVRSAVLTERGVAALTEPQGTAHEEWRRELAEARQRLDNLMDLVADGVLDAQGPARGKLQAAQERVRELAQSEPTSADEEAAARVEAVELALNLGELATEEWKRLVRMVVDRVEVSPPPEEWGTNYSKPAEEHEARVSVELVLGWKHAEGDVAAEWGQAQAEEYGLEDVS